MSTGTQQHLPTLDDSEIKRIQRINEGDCGENWVCEYRGQKLVVKYLRGGDKEFWDEVAMWTDLGHENICPIVGLTTNPRTKLKGLASPYQEHGSLHSYLKAHPNQFDLDTKIQMGIQIACGLSWLHGKTYRIAHLDLKPENGTGIKLQVLIDSHGVCKVHDFGLSQLKLGNKTVIECKGGNLLFAAPEFIDTECGLGKPDTKADVYSFGLLLWNIITEETPNAHITDVATLIEEVVDNQYRPPRRELYSILQLCWQHSPAARPNFSTVIEKLVTYRLSKTLSNEPAKKFWKTNFYKENMVETERFLTALWDELEGTGVDHRISAWLMDQVGNPRTIRLTHEFRKLVLWFVGNGEWSSFLTNFVTICEQSYFFGRIQYQGAAELLPHSFPGTFLVRLNLGDRHPIEHHPFTITQKDQDSKILNWSIVPGANGKGYKVVIAGQDVCGPTLVSLIQNLQAKFPEKFKRAAEGHPFHHSARYKELS